MTLPDDFIFLAPDEGPWRVDLVYADADHPENIFGIAFYKPEAKLWLHKDLARVVIEAATRAKAEHNETLVIKDGLRPVEAQAAMIETPVARTNPHWTQPGPNRLLSPPGAGGHPRGMAVDITLESADSTPVDMGTAFDYLTPDPAHNPAARDFTALAKEVLDNRARLSALMTEAGESCGVDIVPLSSEWWDFRLPLEIISRHKPLSDKDLPPSMRMTNGTPDHGHTADQDV